MWVVDSSLAGALVAILWRDDDQNAGGFATHAAIAVLGAAVEADCVANIQHMLVVIDDYGKLSFEDVQKLLAIMTMRLGCAVIGGEFRPIGLEAAIAQGVVQVLEQKGWRGFCWVNAPFAAKDSVRFNFGRPEGPR